MRMILGVALVWSTVAHAAPAAWVKRSNEDAQLLLDVNARFQPEGASELGLEGHDEEVADLKPGFSERLQAAYKTAGDQLRQRLAVEKDPVVRQDLEILIKAANDGIRGEELARKYDVTYINVPELVFGGVHALLDEQISPARRQKVVARVRRYAGLDKGYEPITKLAEDRFRERAGRAELKGPPRAEVEKHLANTGFFIDGIEQLFKQYKIADGGALAKLREELTAYQAFVQKEVLPRARTDFRLPPEQYAFQLDQVGVDIPPAELTKKAHAAFDDLQKQMQVLAATVAKQKGFAATDYREVVKQLKKDQLVGPAILPHYQQRLKDLEAIIVAQKLLTLPARAARIRLASEAESAQVPAPNMHPPRLVGNTGEMGEFILPLRVPAPPGAKQKTQQFDDFTFAAASWTLTAHEARPGHELQFAAVVEKGVSIARALFAFNSTNVEGWGLYAESIALPFMPPEGQLISLQHRMMRAARAFLDPELQMGKVTPTQARELLRHDVCLSDAMADQEVERYTFRSPGQATAYFYGYTRLMELRADVQKAQGAKFDATKLHDFILAQGLLPPALLRKAVFADLVGTPPPPTN